MNASTPLLSLVTLLLGTGALAADPPSAEPAQPFTSKQQFGKFMRHYNENPQPELIEPAVRYAASSDVINQDDTDLLTQAGFSCLFARHPEQKATLKKTIAALPPPARQYFQVAIDMDPADLFMQVSQRPKKNDMAWACYFVTGDIDYVQDVILAMKHLSERKDVMLFLTGSSAQWSLSGISRKDAAVRAALQKTAQGSDELLAAAASDALTKSPGELREATGAMLKAQKEAGAWK